MSDEKRGWCSDVHKVGRRNRELIGSSLIANLVDELIQGL